MFDAQQYKNNYNKQNYTTITWRIPKEKREVLAELSETQHKSINRLITEAVEKQYHIDLTIVESKLEGNE